MKRNFVLMVAFAVAAFAISASAQKTPDYSGKWNLDVSKLSGQQAQMIKSEVLTITQSGSSFKLSRQMERNTPPAGAPGGGGRGGFGGGGDQAFTLDGKEMTMDMPGPGGATVPVKMSGKWDGSKIVTMTSRTFTNPQSGESMTSTSKTTYELGVDGKTLTVTTETTGGRGPGSSSRVYTKG